MAMKFAERDSVAMKLQCLLFMWNHWIARTLSSEEPFRDAETCHLAWTCLRKTFPDALAVILMPNHLHLIDPINPKNKSIHQKLYKLSGILGTICKHIGVSTLWQTIPKPSIIPDRHHLRRQIRYVALNPCRKKLCSDPLEWLWSTYRDVIGATAKPWVSASQLANILGESKNGFIVRFHTYVSADPSVRVMGTQLQQPVQPRKLAEESIRDILVSSAMALQKDISEIRRRGALRALFVHLAYRQGWTQPHLLSKICGISPRAIHLIMNQDPPQGMEAAALCLGDRRLRTLQPLSSQKEKKVPGEMTSPPENFTFSEENAGRDQAIIL